MANKPTNVINIAPTNRDISGGPAPEGSPFRVILLAVDNSDKSCTVKVSPHSRVYASPNVKDDVQIIGLNLEHELVYGQKLWLETFYDKNLSPVFSIVVVDTKWRAQTVNPANTATTVDVYPNELEFITKFDLANKVSDLDGVIARVSAMQAAAIRELTYQKNSGLMSQEVYAETVEHANAAYESVRDLIDEYKTNLNLFFAGAPDTLWRKLFRTYTLIAYTTRDLARDLEGTLISPRNSAPVTIPSVPQASAQIDYRIVQCLHSDLLLAEYCYQSRYPARLPLPYHRPVYDYFENGNEEDVTNSV